MKHHPNCYQQGACVCYHELIEDLKAENRKLKSILSVQSLAARMKPVLQSYGLYPASKTPVGKALSMKLARAIRKASK